MASKESQTMPPEPAWKKPLKQLADLLNEYEESVNREHRRRELIQQIDREIQRATYSAEEVYKLVLEQGLDEVGADYGHILEINGYKLRLIASRYPIPIEERQAPINGSLGGRALREGKILNIPDVTQLPPSEYHPAHEDTLSELAIPITDYRGVKKLGVFNVERRVEGKFDEEAVKFCKLLRGQIAIAMEQVKVWEGVGLIYDLSSEVLSGQTELSEIYDQVLKKILTLLQFHLGQILLVDQDKLIIVASSNQEDVGKTFGATDSVCGAYIIGEKGRVPLIINNLPESKYYRFYKWLLGSDEKQEMKSEFVVPLLSNEKVVVGVINIEDQRRAAFSEFDEHMLNILGNMIAEAIESATRRKSMQDITYAKGIDLVLTQLGHLSIGFLHSFGGKIADTKARLAELKREISVHEINLPDFGEESERV